MIKGIFKRILDFYIVCLMGLVSSIKVDLELLY